MVLALAAACAYGWGALVSKRKPTPPLHPSWVVAWALHGVVLLAGLTGLAGMHFGFAPALSVTLWLVVAVYGAESRLQPQLRAHAALALAGAAAVLLALAFPGKALHSAASMWLPAHWALGLASYGLFAVAVLHAWMLARAERAMRSGAASGGAGLSTASPQLPLLTLERLTFRFVAAGFVLLTATVLAGALFTEALYGAGKVVKWDHKTIFSLLSWLTFALLLLGRARFGWRGRVATRVLYAGAGLLLLAYAGSRFVLEVVLGRVA